MQLIDEDLIALYSNYSYIPKVNSLLFSDIECTTSDFSLHETSREWSENIRRCLAYADHSKQHIVPLSGGWDSRIILASLLEHLSPNQITLVTFGEEGLLDYEIAQKISNETGCEIVKIDLRSFDLSWENQLTSVNRISWTYMPDRLINSTIHKRFSGCNIWSGFLGDPVSGSHYVDDSGLSDDEVINIFFNKQIRSKKFSKLFKVNHNHEKIRNELSSRPPNFTRSEWLDFSVRQYSCIAPIIFPSGEWKNLEGISRFGGTVFITPFATLEWMSYMMSMPRELHKAQNRYLDMAFFKYPKIMNLGIKNKWGYHRNSVIRPLLSAASNRFRNRLAMSIRSPTMIKRKMPNYIDFHRGFLLREDLQKNVIFADEFLSSLGLTKKDQLNRVLLDHQKFKVDDHEYLNMAISLAINLYTLDKSV